MKRKIYFFFFVLITLFLISKIHLASSSLISPFPEKQDSACLWQICSVDTMKTSRDRARAELYNPQYDSQIKAQVSFVKETGANYISLGTPYDAEFLPYLKRWVKEARSQKLKVWFRGNWSSWEGWFDYPKNMSPEEHLKRTSDFIIKNPDLFEDEDILDSCPECENSQFWPQPVKNNEYNQFIQKQQETNKQAFKKINKNVITNVGSIIGGRAKEVLDQKTLDKLDNLASIDHYVKSPKLMSDYVDYFSSKNTKVLVSEFGAPIPDLNGDMSEEAQADFVGQILEALYKKGDKVYGFNYWVLSEGTTKLINDDYSKRAVFDVLKNYFIPEKIQGTVTNTLGDILDNITIKTSDGARVTKTNANGYFEILLPARSIDLTLENEEYKSQKVSIAKGSSGQITQKDFILEPTNPGIIYRLKLYLNYFFSKIS